MSNFLVEVKEAEQKAIELVEKASKKAQDEVLRYRQELAKKQDVSHKEAQEKMRAELQKSHINSRKKYEEKVAAGAAESAVFKSAKINMIDGLMKEATELFLEKL